MPEKKKDAEILCQVGGQDPIQKLIAVWGAVMEISKAYTNSQLQFDAAVRILACSAAELQATLYLAGLDEDALSDLSRLEPSITTWYLFASADENAFKAGIDAIKKRKPGESSFMAVFEAMRAASGPTILGRLGALPGKVIWHMAHKAKQYDVLSKGARKFLGDIAKLREKNGRLTPKQLEYLKGVAEELVNKNVISPNSKDNDQDICDEILKSLGRK
jgi:hypothetical protein